MKKLFFLSTILALIIFTSCGGSTNESNSKNEAIITQEVQKLDSLSSEMETTSTEIDNNTKALNDALEELEKEFEQ